MLQKMNERIKGIFAWLVILFISFTFVLFGVDYFFQSRQSNNNRVAEVNGDFISSIQFESAYRRLLQQMSPQERLKNEIQLKQQVVQDLIINTVLAQAARHAGLFISPQQANALITQLPQLQESGHFSVERYRQLLAAIYDTPEAFLQEVVQSMLIHQQRFGMMDTAFVLPSELEQYARFFFEKRSYAFLELPLTVFEKQVTVTEAEAKSYYEKHVREFDIPPRIQVAYLLVSQGDLKSETDIPQTQIKTYYEENKASFTQPARWKVAHVLFAFPKQNSPSSTQKVTQKAQQAYVFLSAHPEAFNEWAKQHSDDLLSAQQGGELPWIVGGGALDSVLSSLTKPGQISKPYSTDKGVELFKLIAYEPPAIPSFDQVKSLIQNQLRAEKVQTAYSSLIEALNELTYQSPESLEPAAKALNLPILHSQPFTQDGGTGIMQLPQVKHAAFSKEVLELGNNSEVIQLDDSKVLVLRVEKQFPLTRQSFTEAKTAIEARLKQSKARVLAETIVAELNQGRVNPLIASYPWREQAAVTREEQANPPFMRDLAFTVSSVNQIKGVFLPNGDYVLLKLKSKKPGQLALLSAQQAADFQEKITHLIGKLEFDLYLEKLMQQAKIEKNQTS